MASRPAIPSAAAVPPSPRATSPACPARRPRPSAPAASPATARPRRPAPAARSRPPSATTSPAATRSRPGSRASARQLIDGLIIGVGALILFLPIGAALGIAGASDSDTGIGAAIVALLFWVLCVTVVAFLYAPILMARTNGKTLGRMAMNIRVVRTSGEPVTFWFAFLREVVVKSFLFGFISSFTAGIASLLDVLWPLWDEENRALHDFIVSTRVVKD